MKGVMFFVPEWNEEATDKFAELGTGSIEPLVLSDFTMSSNDKKDNQSLSNSKKMYYDVFCEFVFFTTKSKSII